MSEENKEVVMVEEKSKAKSLTVIVSVIGIIISIGGAALGYNITATEVEEISSILIGLGTAITSAIAIYGRIRATKKLK